MQTSSLRLVYFSPTGTTQKVLEEIARGINIDSLEQIDITKPESRNRQLETSEDELLIVGVPVYFGRVQMNAMEWLHTMKGHNTPTVCVVVYGNRNYDDALLELKETMIKNGCVPIACAAYVGEHTFSHPETPIAAGRPDADDLLHAESFGRKIRDKIMSVPEVALVGDIAVPGNSPYLDTSENRKKLPSVELVAVDSHCVQCGECARVCPVGAIDPEHSELVDKDKCILCHACIKHCPNGARTVKDEMIKNIALRMGGALQDRKEPVVFL